MFYICWVSWLAYSCHILSLILHDICAKPVIISIKVPNSMCRGLNSSRPAVQTHITVPFTLISNSAFLVAFPTKAKVILYFSRTFPLATESGGYRFLLSGVWPFSDYKSQPPGSIVSLVPILEVRPAFSPRTQLYMSMTFVSCWPLSAPFPRLIAIGLVD